LIEGKDLPPPMTDVGQRRRRTDRRRPPDRSFSEEEPDYFQPMPFDRRSWEEVERDYVLYLMKTNNWNITRAAKTAKVNRSTFVSRMRRLGVARKR